MKYEMHLNYHEQSRIKMQMQGKQDDLPTYLGPWGPKDPVIGDVC
jgi:hypothetical protein